MLDHLRTAVDHLALPVDGDVLADAFAVFQRFETKLSAAVREHDALGVWEDDASVSMTAWLRVHTAMTGPQAARWVRRATRLAMLPVTRAAWEDGTLSTGQVEVILANLRDRTIDLFADHEAGLIPDLCPLPIAELTVAMQDWAAKAAAVTDPDREPPEPERTCHLSPTLDGRGELRATLDAEGRHLAAAALRLAETRDRDGDPVRSPAQRRGDALVEVLRHYCTHHIATGGARHRPHLNVVIDLDQLQDRGPGSFFDRTPCDAATARRIACDAGVHRVLRAGSSVLDYGRTTRTIPAPTYTALTLRDGGCRFPDCDRPATWCDGHHIWHWADGGPTDLSNLVLLCSRHHHRIHADDWALHLDPDATLTITSPDGTVRASHPPPHRADRSPGGPAPPRRPPDQHRQPARV